MIKQLREALGIPKAFQEPREYLSAAYDLLVLGRKPQPAAEANRFTLHRQCARYGRDLLLGIQSLEDEVQPGHDLELWLDGAEPYVEGYRTSYRALTGVDLGASATPTIEQAV